MKTTFAARAFAQLTGLLAATLVSLTLAPASAATIEWVNFSTYTSGSQAQTGLASDDGLVVDVAFSNRIGFDASAPAGTSANLNDASWPFDDPVIPMLAAYGSGGGPDISVQLTVSFTNPGGLPAGGSIAVADLETAGTTVTITGLAGGSPVAVNWTLANYNLEDSVIPFPTWNAATNTLAAPGVPGDGGISAFTFLTSDVALDGIRLSIVGAVGDGTAYGFTRSAVTAVPAPPALLLLATGFASLAIRARRSRRRG